MRQSRAQAVAGIALGVGVVLAVGTALMLRRRSPFPRRRIDYSERSGFPRPVEEMRGSAAKKARAQGPLLPETRAI